LGLALWRMGEEEGRRLVEEAKEVLGGLGGTGHYDFMFLEKEERKIRNRME